MFGERKKNRLYCAVRKFSYRPIVRVPGLFRNECQYRGARRAQCSGPVTPLPNYGQLKNNRAALGEKNIVAANGGHALA